MTLPSRKGITTMNTNAKNHGIGPKMLAALMLVLGIGFVATGADTPQDRKPEPPGSLEIFDTLDRLWKNKQYAEADLCARELHSSWSNYVPAQLTWAIHPFHFGNQLEDCIERIRALKAILEKDISLAPPMLLSGLDNFIQREEDTLAFYENNGHDRARRAAEQNPLSPQAKVKPASRWLWMEDYFYSLAPEAILGDEVVWRESSPPRLDKKYEGLSDKDLHWLLGVDETALTDKMAICRELTRRMWETGGAEKVVWSFLGANAAYLYPAMVASLMASPDEAIPALVAFLDNPIKQRINPARQRKMAIWALVRIGRADGEVLRALEDCRAAHPDDELGDYATRAIDYLTRRAGK